MAASPTTAAPRGSCRAAIAWLAFGWLLLLAGLGMVGYNALPYLLGSVPMPPDALSLVGPLFTPPDLALPPVYMQLAPALVIGLLLCLLVLLVPLTFAPRRP